MENDPEHAAKQRLADALAVAYLNVMACQERATRSAEQLADARAAMAQSLNRFNEAKATLEQISSLAWMQTGRSD